MCYDPAVEHTPHHGEDAGVSRRTDLLVALVLALAVFVLDQGLKAIVQGAMSPGRASP